MQFVGKWASYCNISLIFLLNKCGTSEIIGNVGDFYHYGPFINPQAFAFYIIDTVTRSRSIFLTLASGQKTIAGPGNSIRRENHFILPKTNLSEARLSLKFTLH